MSSSVTGRRYARRANIGENLPGALIFVLVAGGTAHKNLVAAGRFSRSLCIVWPADLDAFHARIALRWASDHRAAFSQAAA